VEIEVKLSELHPGQKQVLDEAKRFNVLSCGRRWGKSELAIDLLCNTAIDGFPVGYFTPIYRLLEGTYNECVNILEPLITAKNDQKFIELRGGGRIEFWSMDNEMAGRSKKYKMVILDECAFTRNLWTIWTESIRATLTDLKGDAWFLSTPRGKNDFYKLWMRARQGEDNWASWQMSTYTNPHIDKSELDDAKHDLPESAFAQEYMAEFQDNTANPFQTISIAQCTFPMTNNPPVVYGIDLAKSVDFTVIIGLDKHGAVCHFNRFNRTDWQHVVRTILDLPKAHIVIDSTGVGDPIAEQINRERRVEMFQFSSKSKQQLMEGLALAIQQRKVSFPEGHITDELYNFEYQHTSTGVKYSAPSGLHDDCVCALALAIHGFKKASLNDGNISIW